MQNVDDVKKSLYVKILFLLMNEPEYYINKK
jgi:hypothetical protein